MPAGRSAGLGDARGQRRGLAALVAACTIWGLAPIVYRALDHVPSAEVLSHRTIWALLMFAVWLGVQRRLGAVRALLGGRERLWVLAAAALVGVNWYAFIWSIQHGRSVEASLGYYIFPLLVVGLGVIVFGEPFTRAKLAALGLAGAAVGLLTWGLGAAPWMALFLAVTFAAYAVIKRRLNAGPVVSITAESLLLSVPAAIWLGRTIVAGEGHFTADPATASLLVFTGAITAVPLMLFSFASRQVSMAAFGLTQYLNPTLQFLVAALYFHDPVTRWHLWALAIIWVAVLVYAIAGLRPGGRAAAA
jgi:chloramphenicol-sensitive protein RarD